MATPNRRIATHPEWTSLILCNNTECSRSPVVLEHVLRQRGVHVESVEAEVSELQALPDGAENAQFLRRRRPPRQLQVRVVHETAARHCEQMTYGNACLLNSPCRMTSQIYSCSTLKQSDDFTVGGRWPVVWNRGLIPAYFAQIEKLNQAANEQRRFALGRAGPLHAVCRVLRMCWTLVRGSVGCSLLSERWST